MSVPLENRRRVLVGVASTVALSLTGAGCKRGEMTPSDSVSGKSEHDDAIDAGEDLMREHGVLRRVLLVYEEGIRRIESGEELTQDSLLQSAQLIRRFVEDYHERQEEETIFPRFERAKKFVELVRILRAQHDAGRRVTDRILALANATSLRDPQVRRELEGQLRAFTRMYRPHAAREDTVLFPALHGIVSSNEYDSLGEDFERRERQIFGGDGFSQAVRQLEIIERSLGIDDLARVTPSG